VTGGSGFIGHNLVLSLVEDGHDVVVIDDLSTGLLANRVDGAEYIYESILDDTLQRISSSFQPDVIFHLAAIPRVSYSVEEPFITTNVNVLGSLAVFDAARISNSRVVASSSSSVYGGADVMPTPESHCFNPQSPYALDKIQMEEWGRLYHKLYGLDCVFLRYFNVFGPHALYGGAYSTVLAGWLYSLYVDQDVKPFLEGDGHQTRDFCYVGNVVDANLQAAFHEKGFSGQAFNVAQGQSHSLLDCKSLLEQISGKKLDLEMRPERKGDVRHTLADISLAQEVFNYTPWNDFEEQVSKMARWYEHDYNGQ
jgi:nucleoside-diphosphate-sugar epimerase